MTGAWITLFLAGLLEVCWAVGLKYTEGFTKLFPSIFTLVTLVGSLFLLAKVAQALPLGTAYGVWVGIGAIGTVLFGIFIFKEPVTMSRIGFLLLLVISIIGLKLTSGH